ncbi:hypothetical protein GLOTRDRAFT_115631 [Gloeophyllum trabeum ATCC 11539]|uniref:Phytase-like domain-containing protein n=1 Tax=Gloeophyllum trabeum (strain ATCC 11539 / FP-39264 / Madison 617) TaxID=670483 RepID=S7RP72_GLOTA|nr:uncharacterized protein GLOTRDRAFT_115631 [Gloeophyllum trabeum ATCC 11539]EPQ56340.1 hypothetical protein GLOTRDRAFT_115631 [Gloeophyllum trabeum ATCC 11539]
MHVLFAFLLLFVAQAYAAPGGFVRETNGQRIARGLPPLPAKLGKVLPGRDQFYKPTPAFGKRSAASASPSPSPSAAPGLSYIGRIQVRSEDGSPLGYLRSAGGINEINDPTPDDDLYVRVQANRAGAPHDLIGLNHPSGPSFLGARASGAGHLARRSPTTLNLAPVRQTLPGGRPASMADDTYSSAIWSMNLKTKELNAKWINPDGSTPPTLIAYDKDSKTLFLTGDLDAYNEHHDANACAVSFHVTTG